MRSWLVSVAVVCSLFGVVAGAARPWSIEFIWGDSMPGGTTYTVTISSASTLHAERKGFPLTPQGLTVVTFERTVPDETAAAIRSTAERFVRELDFDKVQGRMAGDGGFASVYIWDGSATLGARLGLLRSRDEAGKEWNDLLSVVTPLLPKDFIR